MAARRKVLELGEGGEQLPPEARDRGGVQVRAGEALPGLGDGLGLLRVRARPLQLLGDVGEVGGDGNVVHPRREQRVEVPAE